MKPAVQELYQVFRDKDGKVDLDEVYQLMVAQPSQLKKTSDLMMIKLNQRIQSGPSPKVDRVQLAKILNMNPTDQHNFDLIFKYMSPQDYISLNQLKAMNNKFKLGLTSQQMQNMIDVVNPKSDRLNKAELLHFLTNK